jgi:TldD protein
VNWDDAAVVRWLEPLGGHRGDIAEVFAERLREVVLEWRDGEVRAVRLRREEGTSARWRRGGAEMLVFVPGASEASAREAVRGLRESSGGGALPIRAVKASDAEDEAPPDADRWTRRLVALFGRHAPRHRVLWRVRQTERKAVSPGRPPSTATRRLLSLEGSLVAASRAGDEERDVAFHAPDSEGAPDELRMFFAAAAAPRDRAVPAPAGDSDVVLARGSAALLFHEILGHALEADVDRSPLSSLPDAQVAVPELEVVDDPRRLDLFGGYERDDEGTAPRAVKLLHAGRVGARLTDRAHAGTGASSGHGRRSGATEPPLPRGSNLVVRAGGASSEELVRRLSNGIWIEELRRGSVDLSGGTFRLEFPRARRVRRGRFSDELGPGVLAGEILPALKGIEPVVGRETHACRTMGWCARDGQILPVQGSAPELLLRGLSVRPLP